MSVDNNTNTVRALCPKCNEHIPKIELIIDKVTIICDCNYKEEISLHEYIEQYNKEPNEEAN